MSSQKVVHLPSNVQKRILSDIGELSKDKDLNKNGIFWHINEEDLTKIWIVIFGNENTPYYHCPFFFKFEFGQHYPLKPPSGIFLTSNSKTRFNPNLYVDGKICLSILGTWSGPSWTPVMTIKTVIMSIIALVMNENPLVNEPGYENSKKESLDAYNKIVQYRSIDYAFCDQLKNFPSHFEPIKEQVMNCAISRFEELYKLTLQLKNKFHGEKPNPKYCGSDYLNYEQTIQKLNEFKELHNIEFKEEIKDEVKEEVKEDVKKVKSKSPSEKASTKQVGDVMINEGIEWEVKVNKSGKHYWSKKK